MPELTATQAVAERVAADDDDLTHIACDCDIDTALCGTDLSDADWTEEGPDCVVCEGMDDYYGQLGVCCSKDEEAPHV